MDEKGKDYQQLEKELAPQIPLLEKAADTVLVQDVSQFPIFIVHQSEIDLGIPLINHLETTSLWSVNISTMEEMMAKQVIGADKVENFKSIYKNPGQYFCLFAIMEAGATFIFLPRKKENVVTE